MLKSRMESIGSFVPSTVLTNEDLVGLLDHPGIISAEKLFRVSGVSARRVCDQSSLLGSREDAQENGLSMSLHAAQDALSRSQHSPQDLDIIISCAIMRSRDDRLVSFEPSTALTLKNMLGAPQAIHFDISNACAGTLTGITILDGLIRKGIVRRGMVVSGEPGTTVCEAAVHEVEKNYDLQFASLTTGDAAAAIILEATDSDADCVDNISMATSANFSELCIITPSDKGAYYSMYTDNRGMHNEDRFLLWTHVQGDQLKSRETSFDNEKFDFVIHHQFGGPAIDFMQEIGTREFNTAMPESLTVLEKYGNTASTSHLVVMHENLKNGKIQPGNKVLLVPAASGIVTGCLSVTVGAITL